MNVTVTKFTDEEDNSPTRRTTQCSTTLAIDCRWKCNTRLSQGGQRLRGTTWMRFSMDMCDGSSVAGTTRA